jgi:hypothetical protein
MPFEVFCFAQDKDFSIRPVIKRWCATTPVAPLSLVIFPTLATRYQKKTAISKAHQHGEFLVKTNPVNRQVGIGVKRHGKKAHFHAGRPWHDTNSAPCIPKKAASQPNADPDKKPWKPLLIRIGIQTNRQLALGV